mmetsp:Transcript_2815/g.5369  ORF Transcript_2815/g.5369 Transcript_2815/m.5369 type:complete len:254 (+) Transcript_2815:83-844(+)
MESVAIVSPQVYAELMRYKKYKEKMSKDKRPKDEDGELMNTQKKKKRRGENHTFRFASSSSTSNLENVGTTSRHNSTTTEASAATGTGLGSPTMSSPSLLLEAPPISQFKNLMASESLFTAFVDLETSEKNDGPGGKRQHPLGDIMGGNDKSDSIDGSGNKDEGIIMGNSTGTASSTFGVSKPHKLGAGEPYVGFGHQRGTGHVPGGSAASPTPWHTLGLGGFGGVMDFHHSSDSKTTEDHMPQAKSEDKSSG